MTERKAAFSFEMPNHESFPLELNGKEVATCVPAIDGLAILDFLSITRDSSLPAGVRGGAITNFLRRCFVTTRTETQKDAEGNEVEVEVEDDSEYQKFRAAIRDLKIPIEGLAEIAGKLADVYSERPTMSPVPSGAGHGTGGSSSEENSTSAA